MKPQTVDRRSEILIIFLLSSIFLLSEGPGLTPALCDAEVISLIILPLKNETGDNSLDWLSLGLQEAVTTDLWYVGKLKTLTISQYITTAGRAPRELSNYPDEAALLLGRRLSLDQIWTGSFKKDNSPEIFIELRGLDVRTGKEAFRKGITAALDGILTAGSALVMDILKTNGIAFSEEQRAMISAPRSKTVRAFEFNAKGYEVQQRLPFKKRREWTIYFKEWTGYLKEAVKEDPGYAEAWNNLGWALHTSGDYEGALNAFKTALDIKPYLLDANMGMGFVMRNYRKDFPKAVDYMEKAVNLNRALEWTRRELTNTVLESTDKTTLPYLIRLAREGDKELRLRAINALGRYKDSSLLPLYGELLKDRDKEINYAVIKAVNEIGGMPAIPYLEEALNYSDRSWEVVNMILNLSEEAALPHLLGMLRKGDYREAAAELFGQRKLVATVPYLIEALKEYEALGLASLKALVKIGDKRAVPAMVEAFKDRRKNIREAAISALGEMGAAEAIPAIRDVAQNDKNQYVRINATVSLAGMGDESAIQVLIDIIKGGDRKMRIYTVKLIRRKADKFHGTALEFVLTKKGSKIL